MKRLIIGLLFGILATDAFAYYSRGPGEGRGMAVVNALGAGKSAEEVIRATGPACGTNPSLFSTKYQDDETELLYYGYRYYDAGEGRWLSRDPIEERGFNPGAVNHESLVESREADLIGMGLQRSKFFYNHLLSWLTDPLFEEPAVKAYDNTHLENPRQSLSDSARHNDLSAYAFVRNNPTSAIDPLGLWPLPIYYVCPSTSCGIYQCIGLFNTPTRIPRNKTKLAFCLLAAKDVMDAACLVGNGVTFDKGCKVVMGCLKLYW